MNTSFLRAHRLMFGLGMPSLNDIYNSTSRRSRGLAGRNYKYPVRPQQGGKEKARRVRQIERGIIK